MSRTPEVTVAAVAADNGRFLLVEERINQRLVINQPAGHVEPGESLLAAVIREVREESAWGFEPQALLGVYLWRRPNARRATLRFAFTGALGAHDATRRLDRGIVRTLWLSAPELEAQEPRLRSPLVLRCVHDFLQGQFQSLDAVAQLDLASAAAVAPTTLL
ncbi:MAG TPA: NUDIX hydrolase [Steroidobacteraceae bacterium]|nr:NUDIX hydrolase [Steroidobacteraceae bacterium]